MRIRILGASVLLLLVGLAAAMPSGAQNDQKEKPTLYTYVAQWAVPRAQWGDITKLFEQNRPLLDKLVADGTLTGYGNFATVIHQEGQPTHGTWYTATSVGNLMKTIETLVARPESTSPVLANSKHWDLILESRDYNGHTGTFKGAYLVGSNFQVKPGQGREFRELVKSSILPLLEKLLADGVIHFYSLDSDAYHSEKPGAFHLVYVAADAASIDKVDAAVDEALGKNPTFGPAFRSMFEAEAHRDFLLRVTTMTRK